MTDSAHPAREADPPEPCDPAAHPAPESGAAPALWKTRVLAGTRQRRYWLTLLVLAALFYFGSYVRSGINFQDEGGTVTLIGKRLLEGERPFRDVVLGYNILWFYPVVALFKLFGVNFVLLRGYCFFLSTITAILGFLLVERVTRRAWLAFLVGLLLIAVPGMTFKNYMPLMAVGNSFCLAAYILGRRKAEAASAEPDAERAVAGSWKRLAAGGAVLGLTFLIRIDVGMFFAIIWGGVLAIAACEPAFPGRGRVRFLFGGWGLLLAMVLLVHFPVWVDGKMRGFDQQFVAQYAAWPKGIVKAVSERLGTKKAPVELVAKAKNPLANTVAAAPPKQVEPPLAATPAPKRPVHSWNRDILQRKSWADISNPENRKTAMLAVLLYAPLVSLVPLALIAFGQLLRAYRSTVPGAMRRPLAALALTGGAFTVFPQYFFFRPDGPHLSEFSPGFWVGVVAALFLLFGPGSPGKGRSRFLSWPGLVLAVWLSLHASLFLCRMLPDRWTGTIAARFKRTQMFDAANGVNVYVTKVEQTGLKELAKVISDHSSAGEYLVAYPYHPSVNVLADRPTYEKNVYVDNATRSPTWEAEAVERIKKFKPAVIVLSDWEINGTESSRFSVWAPNATAWIQAHYEFQGVFLDREKFSVYTRREPAAP